ncbi:MAG: hypothetical protein ACTSQP_19535 [Promethearchaeota archaeon]
MSHVRRKPSKHPQRVVRKRSQKREWLSFFLILIMVISILAAIVAIIFSSQGT